MNKQERIRLDNIYKNMPLEEIPWNNPTPPELLIELVDSGRVKPCRAIDLGCGAGNYSIYLARRGFEVTGVDCSATAIKIAKQNAAREGVTCNFLVADVVEELDEVKETWDFAYDWGLLHHILPPQRQKYIDNVHRLLNPGAKYVSLCFSEQDKVFEGSGKYRKTRFGSVLYFSSESELRELFETRFAIMDLRTVEIEGKFDSHVFNYAFMERR